MVAALRELRKLEPGAEFRFWCDRKFAPEAKRIVHEYDSTIKFSTVWAGKLRRYSHLSKLQHLSKSDVLFPNIRDGFLVVIGFIQSIAKLVIWRPDVVFIKGGYVCLPVGYAAALLRIPMVIHDSDAHPGLTNRLLAPYAKFIATGVPLEHYNYPADKAKYIGIPISDEYHHISDTEKHRAVEEYDFDNSRPLVVFVGGGLGARQINDNVALHIEELMKLSNVVLISGTAQYDELKSLTPVSDNRFALEAFLSHGLPQLLAAADVVVTRAGATALLELAALAKPTILVPSHKLIWQVKHAELFANDEAVYMVDEKKFNEPGDKTLVDAVRTVLKDTKLRSKLSKNLSNLAMPHAAEDLAKMILKAVNR